MKFTDNFSDKEHIFDQFKLLIASKLFWCGVILKILLATFFASDYLTKLFIPFVNYFFDSGFANPYKFFFENHNTKIFPYPALMLYLMSLPRIIFAGLIDFNLINSLTILTIRIPILVADFVILMVLTHLIKNHVKKILILYWLSPVLIYINYLHGQLDVLPISMVFVSLYFLFKNQFYIASILIGLAMATKTNIIILVPLYLIYLYNHKTIKFSQLLLNFVIIILVNILINLQFLSSIEFVQMVFHNSEQLKIFDINYLFPSGHKLFFIPLFYILILFYCLRLKTFSRDVYLMFLGFSFGLFTLLIIPMQGWYYWILPFFAYFYIKRFSVKNIIPFYLLQLSYLAYFLIIKDSDHNQILQIIASDFSQNPNLYNFLSSYGFDVDLLVNLAFTILQSILIINCYFIYRFGIVDFVNFKIYSKPYLLGICGDSGAGKTTISDYISQIFVENVDIIRGDDMHKWERGDENWQKLTHLNPKSNWLYQEISYLKSIKNSQPIKRRFYDHKTGKFTQESQLKIGNFAIYEGLHSFYLKQMRDLFDMKVFVNPSEELRKNWKISRDNQKRGHSIQEIEKQLNDRKSDSNKFIKNQLQYADIIIEFFDDNNFSEISLKISAKNSFYLEEIFSKISAIKTLTCSHEYEQNDMQFIQFNGTIAQEQIKDLSYDLKINSHLENLYIYHPKWQENYIGIIQLILVHFIFNNLKNDEK